MTTLSNSASNKRTNDDISGKEQSKKMKLDDTKKKMSNAWAICDCILKRHIYVKKLNQHDKVSEEAHYVDFLFDETRFVEDYKDVLKTSNIEEVIAEIKQEIQRRKNRFNVVCTNRKFISENYNPLHFCLFENLQNLKFAPMKPQQIWTDVFTVELLNTKVCDLLLEEFEHFKSLKMPHSRPNSMNRHGILMKEIGLDGLIDRIRDHIAPWATKTYPHLVGASGLDSWRAFTVEYDASEEAFDKDLATHFDNAEVTVNISLTESYEKGALYFVRDSKMQQVQHRKGSAILHSGRALHGALPVVAGQRTNLILWFRSSGVRNLMCPMCGDPPSLEPVQQGTGDGFIIET